MGFNLLQGAQWVRGACGLQDSQAGPPGGGHSRARQLKRPLRGRGDPDPVRSAFLPAVGRPQQQGLAACAAVGGRVAAVDWGRHGVLRLPCREPGEPGERALRAGGAGPRAGAGPPRLCRAHAGLDAGAVPRDGCPDHSELSFPLYLILSSHRTEHGKDPLDIRSLGGVGLTDLEWGETIFSFEIRLFLKFF